MLNQSADEPLSPLPPRLSPSRANDYVTCPRMFKFKTVERLTSPPNVSTSAGSLSHLVFEKIFDLPRSERTLETALELLGPSWAELLNPPEGTAPHLVAASEGYSALAPEGSAERAEIFKIAKESVEGWFKMETPSRFDPQARELQLEASAEGFRFTGIIDRLDRYTGMLEGDTEPRDIWVITDYKSGSVPKDQYLDKAFSSGLHVYAWLASAAKDDLAKAGLPAGIQVDLLRLVYVRSGDRENGVKTKRISPFAIKTASQRLVAIRKGIEKSAEENCWEPRTGPLCSYCPFVKLCPEGAAEVGRRNTLKAEREARLA